MGERDGTSGAPTPEVDVLVVGAGLSGLYSLYSLRKAGFTVRVLESGDDVGGTWYHNRYPGARCDIESLDYSYSFDEDLQQEWTWSERYASQPEILSYLRHVAERFDLRRDIELRTRVDHASWHDAIARWSISTDDGWYYSAQFLVLATGVLSAAQLPDIPGLSEFAGERYHTADWPHEGADLTGKRVGVIGTGSSATQLIPLVAEDAAHLTVFQRTPNFVMPAQNHPLDDEFQNRWKASYPERRRHARTTKNGHNQPSNVARGADVSAAERRAEFESRWQSGGLYMMRAFTDILTNPDVNAEAGDFVRDKVRSIVDDEETAERLLPPRDLHLGTKRLCSGTNYFETFNRHDVSLVDLRSTPIGRVVPEGLRTADGVVHELDALVLATGFDAMTGSFVRIDVRGRDGQTLREKWSHGPRTYMGVMTHGFPNLFVMAGPQTPSVFSNMVTQAEIHVEWVTACLEALRSAGDTTIEPTLEAEDGWVDHVNDLAASTLYGSSRHSWFWGANTPGKARVFAPYVGGIDRYLATVTESAEHGYSGFVRRGLSTAAHR
ncbi:flavin-containing monooxygenase [Georgenia sp. Z1491]|uniref:flavin-containing monooxygenase n=1 Tax=Georgenia sp. Z1491 TaxID=3416707 RepID=UPI003CEF7D75